MTTTDYSHAPQFDTGPLSWVMSEIRDALGRSHTALNEAAERSAEAQASAIKHAKAYLHQAHGALQMVDVDGAGAMTEAAERALDRFKDGALECTPERAQVIGTAYQAIIEYLDELLSGAPQQPARLFPYYRALKEMLGADRIHPADLFFADLSAPAALRRHVPAAAEPDYTALRARFEKALLPFLKSSDPSAQRANALPLKEAIEQVAEAQDQPLARTFWVAMQGFAELVAEGQLVSDVYIKQLFGLINLQIRRLSQGQGTLPETMLRDALFFIAAAPNPPASALALRRAYRLEGMVPADYDTRRYGRIDADALKSAKESLAKAKQIWDRLAVEIDPALDAEFDQLLTTLAAASEKLGSPGLARLLNEIVRAARDSIKSGRHAHFSLEMATALLFVENNLDKIRQLPEHFDEHAEVVGARLMALAAGETPADAPQWQGELSRKIQQDQTVAVLAAEMKHGLRQVEKVLDDYYADGTKRPTLAQIDPVLHQLQGAVAILDQEDAMRAALHVKDAVRALAAAEGNPELEAASLQNIAQNIGALGFFVDMLAQDADAAKDRFAFNRDEGMLRAVPFEKAAHGESQFDQEPSEEKVVEAPIAPVEAAAPTPPAPVDAAPAGEEEIEAELLEIFISEAQEVLALVAETLPSAEREPSNVETLTVLRRSFHTLKGSGRMVGLNNFGEGAAAVEKVMNLWLSEARPANAELLALLRRATADMTVWVDELAATGTSQRNSAALVEAAGRVQEGLAFSMDAAPMADLPQAEAAQAEVPQIEEAPIEVAPTELAPIELAQIDEPQAEAPALIEADEEVVAAPVLEQEEEEFADLMLDAIEPESVAEPAAEPVTEAPAFVMDDLAIPELDQPIEATLPDEAQIDASLAEPEQPEVDELNEPELLDEPHADEAVEASLGDAPQDEATPDNAVADSPRPSYAPSGNVIEFPSITRQAPVLDDNTKRIGDLEIPLPLYNIYLAETDELVRALTQDFGEWRHEPLRPVTPEAQKAAHTLAGTSATVGFHALREVAHCLEMVLKTHAPVFSDSQRDLLDETLDCARQMLQRFALGELAPAQPELVARLNELCDQLAAQEAAAVYAGADADLAEKLDGLFAGTLDSIVAEAPAEEQAAPAEQEAGTVIEAAAAPVQEDQPELEPELIAETAEPEPVLESIPEPEPEPVVLAAPEPEPEPEPELVAPLAFQSEAESAREKAAVDALLDLEAHDAEAAAPSAVIETPFTDELDADLLPVFLEEGSDLLPEIGNNLRKWQQNPADTGTAQQLLRTLHTVKGSARMAGAMRLGQHTHEIETQIENMVHAGTSTPAAFDELLANYDHALLLFEQLQQPAGAQAAPAAPGTVPATGAAAPVLFPAQTANLDDANAAQSRTPLVRVRADILDRLVNQAGEVSITRSKLETQVANLRASLGDVSENLQRLRRQLREVEMQAESQISSRMSISNEREFDPLEFDRFTRLQELTRGMAESVNDVASFHEALTRTVEGATDDLTQQSRLTRDLQRDLMRVRMVPFASLSERLFRVARQTAKELDKRVNLDIRGGTVEIDRSVLEQMSAPFEHLLRNALVHGIESRDKRAKSGKSETGELLIQVSQQGNEVVIQFNDDGAGLDLQRIRAKARENGLLAPGVEVSDAEAADLIFEPGFSTADALTELAGRGVGMDVVRSQAQALGGRVAIWSDLGKGARFTIHLPLTLAVTQVVLTTSGNKTFALPSILVEQVLQMKEAQVNAAHAAGSIQFQGQKVALHYLPNLLGDSEARPLSQRSCPVLVLKSGTDRLAVQVDDVQGNREVVIKNIGPQLSRMIGISGATVLGSGDIVLILNPVALSHHLDHHPDLKPRAAVATAAAAAAAPETKAQDYVIMVVDDSLTVRKVTQRLLEREGYQVVLAKDGVDALEHLQETIPHLMLVDIEMPRMDGFDLTRNIRGNDSTKDIPIIMITSRTADKHRNYAMDLGVNAYFGKPFQEDTLVAAIAGLLNREMPVAS